MKRRAPAGTGRFLSFLINFAFRYEWGILAVALAVIRIFWKFPLFIVFIPLILWVIHAAAVTAFFSLIAKWASGPFEERPNINPYSRRGGASKGGSSAGNECVTVEAAEAADPASGPQSAETLEDGRLEAADRGAGRAEASPKMIEASEASEKTDPDN